MTIITYILGNVNDGARKLGHQYTHAIGTCVMEGHEVQSLTEFVWEIEGGRKCEQPELEEETASQLCQEPSSESWIGSSIHPSTNNSESCTLSYNIVHHTEVK